MNRPGLRKVVGIILFLPIIFVTGCDKSEKLENAMNKTGGSNLPANVSIRLQDTTRLNISIDTGIR